MFAIIEAKRAGLLSFGGILRNVLPGIVVGIVALPLAMAFAIASGTKPEYGLYTAIVAGICVAIFGGTRAQIAGPTGAFVVILASITEKYGFDGLQMATFMAGGMLIFMGLAKLGSIIKYIPDPVIVGFTSGIAVVIWVGQWKDFFGLNVVIGGSEFHQKLISLVCALHTMDLVTTLISLASLAILILARRYCQKIPGALLALIFGTVLQSIFAFDSVATIGTAFGGIPQKMPSFSIPDFSFSKMLILIGPAFTIALLGAIESLLSAVVADGMLGTKHSSNQELIGQGIANLVCPLFCGFAATGAIARTATNIRNGGNSPIAGIIHSITLLLLILIMAPLAKNIPLATLAAILFIVAYNMSEAGRFIRLIKHSPKSDAAVLIVTFFITVFGDLVVAVNVGVILASLLFMRRMSKAVQVELHTNESFSDNIPLDKLPMDVVVYSINGPFFFGAVERFENAISRIWESKPIKTIIIRLKNVPFIDATGLNSLGEIVRLFACRNIDVIFCEANKSVVEKIKKAKLFNTEKLKTLDKQLASVINNFLS